MKIINWFEKNRKVSIILTILIALIIYYLSSIPGSTKIPGLEEIGINWISVLYHLVIFFLFNFFLLISIKGTKEMKAYYIIIALVVSVIYGALDEVHQIFVPFRYATIYDVITDAVGAVLSVLVLIFAKKFK